MYATARFNAYVSWIGFDNADDMANIRDETVKYFIGQYQIMLEENLDDHIPTSKNTKRGKHIEAASIIRNVLGDRVLQTVHVIIRLL